MIGQAQRVYQLNKGFALNLGNVKNSNYIAFTSGKGGTGKSFCSLNIAAHLAALGKKILLVDLDFNLSNLHLMLDVIPQSTISDVLNHNKTVDEIINQIEPNLDVIYGDSGNPEFSISLDEIRLFFSSLKSVSKKYDLVLFDMGSGAGDEILEVLMLMDKIILVSTPEPTSVMDAYVVVKLLKQKKIGVKLFSLINKCPDSDAGSIAFENLKNAITHFLKEEINYLGSIDFSSDVLKSIISQKPLYSSENGANINIQISNLSSKIAKITQMVNNNH